MVYKPVVGDKVRVRSKKDEGIWYQEKKKKNRKWKLMLICIFVICTLNVSVLYLNDFVS